MWEKAFLCMLIIHWTVGKNIEVAWIELDILYDMHLDDLKSIKVWTDGQCSEVNSN